MNEQSKSDKDLENEYQEFSEFFGHQNLRMDLVPKKNEDSDSLFVDLSKVKYTKVRVTHIPSGKVAVGNSYETQMENAIEALKNLKEQFE